MTLFPGTGFADELGEGVAAGTAVNVPLEAGTGERAWLDGAADPAPRTGRRVRARTSSSASTAPTRTPGIRSPTCASRRPRWARRRGWSTTIAHRYAGGRWLATGGGGYDAYRVVPRMWSPGLAGRRASRGPGRDPVRLARALGDRGRPLRPGAAAADRSTTRRTPGGRSTARRRRPRPPRPRPPRAVRRARRAAAAPRGARPRLVGPAGRRRTARGGPDGDRRDARGHRDGRSQRPGIGLALAPRRRRAGRRRSRPRADRGRARRRGARVGGGRAVDDGGAAAIVVGAAVASAEASCSRWASHPTTAARAWPAGCSAASRATLAEVTVAERDPVDPLDRVTRAAVARSLLGVGIFHLGPADRDVRAVDPLAIRATR